MKLFRIRFLAAVISIFLMAGCATLSDLLTRTHYEFFELTLDSKKVVVELPNGLPSMLKSEFAFESCYDAKVCYQRFCLDKEAKVRRLAHDHVDFVFVKDEVLMLLWLKKEKDLDDIGWIYSEGSPTLATFDEIVKFINDLLNKAEPQTL